MGRMKDELIDQQTETWPRVEFTFEGAPTWEHMAAWGPWFLAHGIGPQTVAAKGWIELRPRQIVYLGWNEWRPHYDDRTPRPIVVDLDREPAPFPTVRGRLINAQHDGWEPQNDEAITPPIIAFYDEDGRRLGEAPIRGHGIWTVPPGADSVSVFITAAPPADAG